MIDALRRVLSDASLRATLSAGGLAAARRTSWPKVTEAQEANYREAIASRQASTSAPTDGS